MLTIKHVTERGSEALYEAAEVMFHPVDLQSVSEVAVARPRVGYLANGEWRDLYGDVVYVMNDHGRTIATYRLDPVNVQALSSPVERPTRSRTYESIRTT